MTLNINLLSYFFCLSLFFLPFVTSLDLGYEYDSQNFIINNNKVHEDWLPSTHDMQVDEFESVSTFWVDLKESEVIESQKVKIISGEDIFSPILDGDLAWESQVQKEEDEDFWIDLRVIYRCNTGGVGVLSVSLRVMDSVTGQVQELTFSWEKLCGEGVRLGMNVGTEEGTTDVIEDGETKNEWKGDKLVPRTVSFTSFYLFMDESFGSQTSEPPVVTSSNPVVLVHTRGYASLATEITDTAYPQELTIVYECLGVGTSLVTVSLMIPPFDTLVWSWTKSCGGEVLSGLKIGVTPGGDEVVSKGQPNFSFSSYKSQKDSAYQNFYLQIEDDDTKENSYSQSDIFGLGGNEQIEYEVLETVLVTSSVSGIMRPIVEVNHGPLGPSIIDSREPTVLTVYYGCLKKYQSLEVTVSILIQNHKMVEFTWKKECTRLTPSIDTSYWTANQILALITFMGIIAGISSYLLYHKYSFKKPTRII